MKRKLKLLAIFMCVLLTLSVCISCADSDADDPELYEADFTGAFDTYTQIIGYADSEDEFDEYAQFIYDELNHYHELFTIYDDFDGINNIKTINDNAGIAPVEVDQTIIDLILFGKEMYTLTDGAVNIAMGSVLSIWHDYREEGTEVPALTLLQNAAQHTDINDVIVDEDASTVYLSDPEMSLDVGAVAKGYAAELVKNEVEEKGFSSGLISVGGNICVIGEPASSEKNVWNIGIQDPDSTNDSIAVIGVNDTSVVTSGDYERYYIVDGVRYHHIIDPETLMPADHFRSVTVVTDNAALADALSTALFVKTYEEGLALIENLSEDVECYWITEDLQILYTDGMADLLESN